MDCYSVKNPTNGQTCFDSQFGPMKYDSSLGWIQDADQNPYVDSTNGMSVMPGTFGTPTLSSLTSLVKANSLFKNYGVWLVGLGAAILLYVLFSEK